MHDRFVGCRRTSIANDVSLRRVGIQFVNRNTSISHVQEVMKIKKIKIISAPLTSNGPRNDLVSRAEMIVSDFIATRDDTDDRIAPDYFAYVFRRHMEHGTETFTRDCLRYWEWMSHLRKYPEVAEVALWCFAVQASSAPCERLFSTSGFMDAHLRSKMLPRTLSALTLLKGNASWWERCKDSASVLRTTMTMKTADVHEDIVAEAAARGPPNSMSSRDGDGKGDADLAAGGSSGRQSSSSVSGTTVNNVNARAARLNSNGKRPAAARIRSPANGEQTIEDAFGIAKNSSKGKRKAKRRNGVNVLDYVREAEASDDEDVQSSSLDVQFPAWPAGSARRESSSTASSIAVASGSHEECDSVEGED